MRLSGKKNKAPPSAIYKNSVKRVVPLKLAERKSSKGSIAFRLRDSTTMNIRNDMEPPMSVERVAQCVNPKREDSIKPKMIPPNPATANTAPSQSNPCLWSDERLSGTRQKEIRMTITAIGALRK